MLNHFRFKPMGGQYLLTNDFGRYVFLDKSGFQALLTKRLPAQSPLYQRLKRDMFLFDDHPETFLTRAREPMRDAKRYLFQSTALHIFVVTNRCNGNCLYCQAQDSHARKGDMSTSVAERAVDVALGAPGEYLTFEFQGGEPLLNFETIRHIVQYTEAHKGRKEIAYNLVSNLTLLTDEILAFLLEHHVALSTSLDGPEALHNRNRPYCGGAGTYRDVSAQIDRVREAGIEISAIQTTTRESLAQPQAIVDAYLKIGFHSLFLRPLTPLGFAAEHWDTIGYTPAAFVEFYRAALSYILEVNRTGTRLAENHAAIFLRKIIRGYGENYMELRSPCGAGVGQLAYYLDGGVYTCDEGRMLAEMGNDAFLLGSVLSDTYSSLMENPRCRAVCAASITEVLPACCDCVYQPYCGACPVVNLALEGDIFPRAPGGYRCKIYSGMLDALFSVLQRDDPGETDILSSWIG